jgi:hypothetical protein
MPGIDPDRPGLVNTKGEKQRKSRFLLPGSRFCTKNQMLFQIVGGQIRYSAKQWNFSAYQRILPF